MHSRFYNMVRNNTPKMNRTVVDGLAIDHMKRAEAYVEGIISQAIQSFPDGFKYLGYERCCPLEEFQYITRPRVNKRTIDIAQSDLYMVKYYIAYKDYDIRPCYVLLPFVSEGGTIMMSGARYSIAPILADKVISPAAASVFIRLRRAKITFLRTSISMYINKIRKTTQVIYTSLYDTKKDTGILNTTNAHSCLTHYLLGKYGFTETFKMFAGVVPTVINGNPDESYNLDDWVVCSSSKIKPKTFKQKFYKPSNLTLLVPKKKWNTNVENLVSEFFYIVDHFPDRISVGMIDNIGIWRILLGHIIFSGSYGEGLLHTKICKHFDSVDDYVDIGVIDELADIGYKVSGFYDLLHTVITNYSKWVLTGGDRLNNLYGKEFSILYHILYGITSSIFTTGFKFRKDADKRNQIHDYSKRDLTKKEIEETLSKSFRTGLIYGITKQHACMTLVMYSGDNKFFNITSVMFPQESVSSKSKKATNKGGQRVIDDSQRLHSSLATVGSYLYLPKSSPRGDGRVSPFVQTDNIGRVVVPNKFAPLLLELDKQLKE